jgi:hypothetical protein
MGSINQRNDVTYSASPGRCPRPQNRQRGTEKSLTKRRGRQLRLGVESREADWPLDNSAPYCRSNDCPACTAPACRRDKSDASRRVVIRDDAGGFRHPKHADAFGKRRFIFALVQSLPIPICRRTHGWASVFYSLHILTRPPLPRVQRHLYRWISNENKRRNGDTSV